MEAQNKLDQSQGLHTRKRGMVEREKGKGGGPGRETESETDYKDWLT